MLYNIYTADIPTPKHCNIAQFADDTALFYSNRQMKPLHDRLQKDVVELTAWFSKWRIKVNAKKTAAIYFSPRRRHKKPDTIKVNSHNVPWTNRVKYLGLVLDERLNYTGHTEELKKKIAATTKKLYPLINTNSKLPIENKIKLIKTMLTPIATYAGELWHQTSELQKNKIQSKINKIIRFAVNAPRYMTNETLQEELNVESFKTIIFRRTQGTIERTTSHDNPTVRKIVQPRRTIKKEGISRIKRRAEEKGINGDPKRRKQGK